MRKGYYTGEIMVHLITTSTAEETIIFEWSRIIEEQIVEGSIRSVLWTKNDSAADAVKK